MQGAGPLLGPALRDRGMTWGAQATAVLSTQYTWPDALSQPPPVGLKPQPLTHPVQQSPPPPMELALSVVGNDSTFTSSGLRAIGMSPGQGWPKDRENR